MVAYIDVNGNIGNLINLKDIGALDLRDTAVTEDISSLANFTYIMILNLNNTMVSGDVGSVSCDML